MVEHKSGAAAICENILPIQVLEGRPVEFHWQVGRPIGLLEQCCADTPAIAEKEMRRKGRLVLVRKLSPCERVFIANRSVRFCCGGCVHLVQEQQVSF